MSLSDGVVTGEAVALDLRAARAASRGLALFIDAIVQVALLVALSIGGVAIAAALGGDEAVTAAIGLVGVVSALVGYPVVCETASRGRSLGKVALGLRVVRVDGGAIRFRHALIRALFGVIEIWASGGSIALIASLASKDGKRLGDQFAGTVVVHDRARAAAPVHWSVPPRMTSWAPHADVGRVPDDLALAVRTFLLRAPAFDAGVRWNTAVDLANRISAMTAPAVPPGVHPEEYLVAVLAVRQSNATRERPNELGGF